MSAQKQARSSLRKTMMSTRSTTTTTQRITSTTERTMTMMTLEAVEVPTRVVEVWYPSPRPRLLLSLIVSSLRRI